MVHGHIPEAKDVLGGIQIVLADGDHQVCSLQGECEAGVGLLKSEIAVGFQDEHFDLIGLESASVLAQQDGDVVLEGVGAKCFRIEHAQWSGPTADGDRLVALLEAELAVHGPMAGSGGPGGSEGGGGAEVGGVIPTHLAEVFGQRVRLSTRGLQSDVDDPGGSLIEEAGLHMVGVGRGQRRLGIAVLFVVMPVVKR